MIHPFKAYITATKILEDWDDVCTALNIPHFLLLGTCLGFHRNKGYIEGDSDLDVGVLCDPQRVNILAKALLERGIEDGGHLISNINFKRHGVLLDVWHKFGPLHHKYFDNLDVIVYEGRTYNTPSPIEGYLEFTYFDWKTPTAYNARGADGSLIGKPQRSACNYTSGGPVLR